MFSLSFLQNTTLDEEIFKLLGMQSVKLQKPLENVQKAGATLLNRQYNIVCFVSDIVQQAYIPHSLHSKVFPWGLTNKVPIPVLHFQRAVSYTPQSTFEENLLLGPTTWVHSNSLRLTDFSHVDGLQCVHCYVVELLTLVCIFNGVFVHNLKYPQTKLQKWQIHVLLSCLALHIFRDFGNKCLHHFVWP